MKKMKFELIIILASFILTAILGIIILPILRKLKVGQSERDDGPESHLKKKGTPTMGGLMIAAMLLIMAVFLFFYWFKSNPENSHTIIPLVVITMGFGLVGFIDDYKKVVLKDTKGLKPSYKMIGLIFFATIFTLYISKVLNIGTDIYIPIVKTYINLPIWIYVPFAIFVLAGTTNAVNLTDGVDGLASTVCSIILACLVAISICFGVPVISAFGSILIGGCLGFLLFNKKPAKVFMGDTGSLFLGGAISAMALYLKVPLILIVIALIPIVETLSVMIQVAYFKKTGKRVFKMAPIHHHFELSGWSEEKVVIVFGLVTLVLCTIGFFIVV